MTKYAARKGSSLGSKDAAKVAAVCTKISNANVAVTPSSMLNRAESPNSTIHHLFEWDNTVAAQRFRLFQARNLINSVVEITIDTKKAVKSYFSISMEAADPEYLSRRVVQTDENARDLMSARFYRMLLTYSQNAIDLGLGDERAWKRLYEDIRKNVPEAAKE